MIYLLVDQFDQSSDLIMSIGACKLCGQERILVDNECTSCLEDRFPLLKDMMLERGTQGNGES